MNDGATGSVAPARHTALHCLVAIGRHHGLELDVDRIVQTSGLTDEPSPEYLRTIAEEGGLKARVVRLDWDGLAALGAVLPAIAFLQNGNAVIVVACDDDEQKVRVVDPMAASAGLLTLDRARFEASAAGTYLLAKRSYALGDPEQPFGLRWFIPELLRQRAHLIDVGVIATALNVIALAVPIFFQIVIDKVLVHHSISTLTVIGIGVLVAIGFDTVLGYLRGYLLLHATTKVDVRLATRTFERLMSLPSAFFERTTAGVLAKHMQQASTVREFLTGRMFLTLLDATILLVFVPVLAFYSISLTLVVLGFSGLICLVIALLVKPYQRRLRQLYTAEGTRQTMLVESIHGMQTIKALSLEPGQRRTWDAQAANAVERNAEVGRIALAARQISGLLQQLMTVAIIWVGASLVFAGRMTVGELIAFQMLAGRVSGPLVQLVTLIHEYQEAALSIRMLGEIMNQPPERNLGRGMRRRLQGAISLQDVRFTYPGVTAPALDGINLEIAPGSFVGIVGPSGSGKTTLTRLIQTLHPVQGGILRFDGIDVRELDLSELRRQFGVVLQDAFLFRGTVRENIAMARVGATMAEIIEAAREAGAEEFIERLPQGYETVLEEGATNLSGGQKQRLSIARALLRSPPILILDEATSALDPDSEAIVVANLERFARSRTTLVISHRLTTIRSADTILVLDEGKLVGNAPHDRLLQECEVYRHLWQQQTRRAA